MEGKTKSKDKSEQALGGASVSVSASENRPSYGNLSGGELLTLFTFCVSY